MAGKRQRPIVKCEICGYTCHGTQALGRHMHYRHPEKSKRSKVTVEREFLHGLIYTMEELLDRQKTGQDTEGIQQDIREQEVKLRLKLVAVALAKAQRVVDNQLLLGKLDEALSTTINDPLKRSYLSPDTLISMRKALSEDTKEDTSFIQSILNMKETGEASFFERLIRMLETGEVRAKNIIHGKERTFELISFDNPEDATNLKKLMGHLIAKSDESSNQLESDVQDKK